jgi:hypothetical protein
MQDACSCRMYMCTCRNAAIRTCLLTAAGGGARRQRVGGAAFALIPSSFTAMVGLGVACTVVPAPPSTPVAIMAATPLPDPLSVPTAASSAPATTTSARAAPADPPVPMPAHVAASLPASARATASVPGSRTVLVGKAGYIAEQCGGAWTEAHERARRTLAEDGHTVVAVAIDGRPALLLALTNHVRPHPPHQCVSVCVCVCGTRVKR